MVLQKVLVFLPFSFSIFAWIRIIFLTPIFSSMHAVVPLTIGSFELSVSYRMRIIAVCAMLEYFTWLSPLNPSTLRGKKRILSLCLGEFTITLEYVYQLFGLPPFGKITPAQHTLPSQREGLDTLGLWYTQSGS